MWNLGEHDTYVFRPTRKSQVLEQKHRRAEYVLEAPDGVIWLTSRNALFEVREDPLHLYEGHQKQSRRITDWLVAQDGRIYQGTVDGLFSYDGHSWTDHSRTPIIPC